MENFIYNVPTKVYFGKDEVNKIGEIIAEFAPKKVLIHYGGKSAVASGLIDLVKNKLDEHQIAHVELGGVVPNPELTLVREGIALCLAEGVDFVLAVGGGSVMDSAKDIANGAANPDVDVWDFSLGKTSPKRTLKKGCILTLSAAGSEMSSSCVISNRATGEKRGYNTPHNRMDFAIEDPTLTYTVSPYQTACGITDICMHTIERYFCPGSGNYLTDAVAEAIIVNTMKAGLACLKDPEDYDARANMMWASSIAHNDLTGCGKKTQLIVHQLEHEVSALYPEVAHGAGLAALWCSWARYVYTANIPRWLQYANRVWNIPIDFEHPEVTIEKAIDAQEAFYQQIGMPIGLNAFGVKETDLEPMALATSRNKTRSLSGDKPLAYDDILAIFNMAFERDRILN